MNGRQAVRDYHDGTKHAFDRLARSMGYLDWANQPSPFRSFNDSPVYPLAPPSRTPDHSSPAYDALFDGPPPPVVPVTRASIGDFLRHALGLSAWKQLGSSRWPLRVNPSSGNLHPTEAYLICGPIDDLSDSPSVYHYAPDRHALELRCTFNPETWRAISPRNDLQLVVLTSIHWRESWKYGERAFRYCQHDMGHAVAAVALSAALQGRRARMLPEWAHTSIAQLAGLNRDEDFVEAEREEPACLLAIEAEGAADPPRLAQDALLQSIVHGRWTGRASQLSEDHVQWTFIDTVATATEDPGRSVPISSDPGSSMGEAPAERRPDRGINARALLRQRRSAVSMNGRSTIELDRFFTMMTRAMPGGGVPWSAMWWTPRVHLVIFVHRVTGLPPGLYLLPRVPSALPRLREALNNPAFDWERAHDRLPLYRLASGGLGGLARRVSCDQDIAADGCFSLGMLAEFDASLDEHGPSFYRHLFWEAGVVGQVLYLEAEAAGARATGIGCFYDDPVHEALGLRDHAFQSLYHFAVGTPVDDSRLQTAPGYAWETGPFVDLPGSVR